jgi:prepilin-type N-terminal cleavage/methylation domain-containing protein/prepilin-type processing-associated H-X9-DG protein
MRKKAFSLIELLVVIAIISLLLSIMLPGIGRAKEQCKSIVCQSRLRQMVLAASGYTCDNDGYFPLAAFINFDNASEQKEWDFFRTFEAGAVKSCSPGFLWQGKTDMEIQQCPSFRGKANSAGDPFTGYNYNTSYIGGILASVFGEIIGSNSSKIDEIERSSDCAIFGDGQFTLGANKFMRAPQTGTLDSSFADKDRYSGTQGYRHLGKTNAAYCDGRVESVKEKFTQTKSKQILDEYNKQNPVKIGFLSSDNSAYDLK